MINTHQLITIRQRIRRIEQRLERMERMLTSTQDAIGVPVAPTSPILQTGERFAAIITADNGDHTYQARRLVSEGANNFQYDPDNTDTITVAHASEIYGAGSLSVSDVVIVHYDGLAADNSPIYHTWS